MPRDLPAYRLSQAPPFLVTGRDGVRCKIELVEVNKRRQLRLIRCEANAAEWIIHDFGPGDHETCEFIILRHGLVIDSGWRLRLFEQLVAERKAIRANLPRNY